MKKSDIAMIVLVASISMMIAFFVTKAVFGGVYTGSIRVKTIDKYTSTVVTPSPAIFNKTAINPAVQVQINGTK